MKPLSFLLISLLIIACNSDKKKNVKPITIEFTKEGELFFMKENDTITTIDIEYARTDYEQQTGLMHREDMKMDQGMLFVYENERPRPTFYMKNTKIALDLIYISADKKVVEINRNTKPMDETSIKAQKPAQYVLEVKAGFADQFQITDGITVDFNSL
jgi:uncharacterized membrane protein (UPF0127 family)